MGDWAYWGSPSRLNTVTKLYFPKNSARLPVVVSLWELGYKQICSPALAKFGNDELRHDYLSQAISGEAVFAIAVSEPQARHDVAAFKVTAKKTVMIT